MLPDEIWDEHRWEAFLREDDQRVGRFMNDLYEFMRMHPPPGEEDAEALDRWKQDLRAFLATRGWDRLNHLPLDFEEDAAGSPESDGLFFLRDANFEEDEGEDVLDDFRAIPAYQTAFQLGTDVLDWANTLPGSVKDSVLVQFCSSIMEIAANITRGHGIGYEQDMIGGNIACVKRSLAAANTALNILAELKEAPYMRSQHYLKLYEQTFEVRNGIAIYIQDLRDRFNLGVD